MKNRRMILIAFMLIVWISFSTMNAIPIEAASYKDGEYTVPLQVLKDTSDEISATSDYIESSAKVIIEQGKLHAKLTLKNSSWWHEFKIRSTDSWNDVTVLSVNEENDTRLVQFPLDDFSVPLNAKIHIIVTGIPGFEYDNKYDIRFQFDSSQIPLVEEEQISEAEKAAASPELETDSQPNTQDQHAVSATDEVPSNNTPVEGDNASEMEQEEINSELDETDVMQEEQANEELTNPSVEEENDQIHEDVASEPTLDNSVTETQPTGSDDRPNRSSTIWLVLLVLSVIVVVGFILWRTRRR